MPYAEHRAPGWPGGGILARSARYERAFDHSASATRNAAFVNLHSAAGVGHAMGNIFTAYRNRTPLVITAGQQARSILPYDPFLYSSQATELPKPYVKWSVEPALISSSGMRQTIRPPKPSKLK